MRRRRRPSRSRFRSLIWGGLILLVSLGFQAWKEVQKQQNAVEPRSGKAAKVFEVMIGAELVEDRNNDGDSFKIRYRGKVHEMRLYFVDCPEKRRHSYNGDRLHEQGEYFGGLSEARTVAIGQQAQAFTRQWLQERPFTIYTKWQGVFGSGRHYAFVMLPDGEDLSAKLVREGLARIHTTGTILPNGRTVDSYEKELRQLESEARTAHRGGWGF